MGVREFTGELDEAPRVREFDGELDNAARRPLPIDVTPSPGGRGDMGASAEEAVQRAPAPRRGGVRAEVKPFVAQEPAAQPAGGSVFDRATPEQIAAAAPHTFSAEEGLALSRNTEPQRQMERAQYAERAQAAAQLDARARKTRGPAQFAMDAAIALGKGGNSLMSLPMALLAPDSAAYAGLKESRATLDSMESPPLRARREQYAQRIAQQPDELGKFTTSLWEAITNPSIGASIALEQMPLMAATIAAGGAGGALAAGGLRAAEAMSPAVAIASAIGNWAPGVTVAGQAVGMAAGGMAMSAGDAAQSVYDRLIDPKQTPASVLASNPDFQAMLAEGKSAARARAEIAQSKSRLAAVFAAPLGLIDATTGLGGAVLRRSAGEAGAGGLRAGARAVASEFGGELTEETGTALVGNAAVSQVDPRQSLTEGLGQTAAETIIGTGPHAAIAGASEYRGADGKPPRPTERRKAIYDRFDDFAAEHGMPRSAVESAKKATDTVPLAELPGKLKRFVQALAKRNAVGRQVSDADLAALDEPPPPAAPAAPPAPASDAIEAPELLDDGTGLADAPPPRSAIDDGAAQAATSPSNDRPEPTQAQKEAGNYKKGPFRLAGMPGKIENEDGTTRRGVDPDGTPWESKTVGHYGYLNGTEGADGDHFDVGIKPGTPPDYEGPVFVIDQIDPKTGKFDEHKARVGYATEDEARASYLANYPEGWQGLGAITQMPMAAFKSWVKDGKKRKPLGQLSNERASSERANQASSVQGVGVDGAAVQRPELQQLQALRGEGDSGRQHNSSTPAQGLGADRSVDATEREAVSVRILARAGRTPTSATDLELRPNSDGTLTPFMEGKALLDYDSGEPISMPADVTDTIAKRMIRDAGAVSSKINFFPPKNAVAPAAGEPAGAAGEQAPVTRSAGPAAAAPRTLDTDGRASDGKPIMPGNTFATASGRQTTPYPKQKGEKYASQWLIDNALAEARSRGDNFNETVFSGEKPLRDGTLPMASRDSMLEYLFGEQPAVPRPFLKPLSPASTAPASAAATTGASDEEGQGQGRRQEVLTPAADGNRDQHRPSAAALERKHPRTVAGSRLLALVSQKLHGLDPKLLSEFSTRQETKRMGRDGRPITAWRNPLIPGFGTFFRSGGAQDYQEIAELLQAEGYLELGAVEADAKEAGERAKDLIKQALQKDEPLTLSEQIAQAQAALDAELAERQAMADQERAEADAEAEAERRAIMAESGLDLGLSTLDDSDIPFDWPGKPDGNDQAGAQDQDAGEAGAAQAAQPGEVRPADAARGEEAGDRGEGLTQDWRAQVSPPTPISELAAKEARESQDSRRVGNTGWFMYDATAARDPLVMLVSAYRPVRVMFQYQLHSGTDHMRARVRAQTWAEENPEAAPESPKGELVVQPLLTAPTPEALQSAADRAAQAEREAANEQRRLERQAAREREQAELADRTRQDASAESFALGQTKADVIKAMAGNKDLFAEPSTAAPATQPAANTETAGEPVAAVRPARDADTQRLIELRKRMSVLEALKACLET